MPWTKKNYPPAMKNLPKEARDKAIEIANAMLEERSMAESIIIPTAISRAKDWAVNHGHKIKDKRKNTRSTDKKKHGQDQYVIPYQGRWAVKREGARRVGKRFSEKSQAVKAAKKTARSANAGVTIQNKSGKVATRVSYNPGKKAAVGKRARRIS